MPRFNSNIRENKSVFVPNSAICLDIKDDSIKSFKHWLNSKNSNSNNLSKPISIHCDIIEVPDINVSSNQNGKQIY